MDNLLELNMTRQQIDAISNLGLAHIGDGVWELLCRSYLCSRGGKNVGKLHHDTIAMVCASAQAAYIDKLLPMLTEEETAWYRRGKNSHVHAVPKGTTPMDYGKATGLEALFGALYLSGRRERLNELFFAAVEDELC